MKKHAFSFSPLPESQTTVLDAGDRSVNVVPALREDGILKQTGMEKMTAATVIDKGWDRSMHKGEALRLRSKTLLTGRADTCFQQD